MVEIGKAWLVLAVFLVGMAFGSGAWGEKKKPEGEVIGLPQVRLKGPVSVEEALSRRRSIRTFSSTMLTLEEISQLFWAMQGVTNPRGLRTAPSAGATYPLEIYAATGEALYQYVPEGHLAKILLKKDLRLLLSQAALDQRSVLEAPVVFVITAVYTRTEKRYKERTDLYVKLEAGHVAENLMLQAVAMKLGTVAVGAFEESKVSAALRLPKAQVPLYLIPCGHPR